MKKIMLLAILTTALYGCVFSTTNCNADSTGSKITYVPIDPIPVKVTCGKEEILKHLYDESMQISTAQLDRLAEASFSTATVGYEKKTYNVVIDYIKYTTYFIEAKRVNKNGVTVVNDTPKTYYLATESGRTLAEGEMESILGFPVYVGVGVRMIANIYVRNGQVDLGSIFSIGAAAHNNQISGSIIFKTLGLSGPDITDLIPIPSTISETSVQNAISAIAGIKAKIHRVDPANLNPRIIGIYNVAGTTPEGINKFILSIYKNNNVVYPPNTICVTPDDNPKGQADPPADGQ